MVARRQCLVVVVGVGRKQRRGMTRGVDDEWGSSGVVVVVVLGALDTMNTQRHAH
jgi:hypothetical protein